MNLGPAVASWGGGSKLRSGHWRSLLLRERSPNERGGTLWRLARCTLTFCNVAEGLEFSWDVYGYFMWQSELTYWTPPFVDWYFNSLHGEMVTSIARWIIKKQWRLSRSSANRGQGIGSDSIWYCFLADCFPLIRLLAFYDWCRLEGLLDEGSGNPGNIVLLIWRFLKGSGMVGQIVGLVTDTRLVSGNVWNPLCSIRHLHNISNPKRSWFSQSESAWWPAAAHLDSPTNHHECHVSQGWLVFVSQFMHRMCQPTKLSREAFPTYL